MTHFSVKSVEFVFGTTYVFLFGLNEHHVQQGRQSHTK